MQRESIWMLAATFLLCVSSPAAHSAEPAGATLPAHKYVGVAKCKSCHKKDLIGDQYGEWEDGDHAKAYEALDSHKARKIAEDKGLTTAPQETDECLECHVTGHGLPAAAFDKKPIPVKEGVSCESCHGPGKDYRKKKIMSDHDQAIAKGLWEPGEDEKICTACHNDRSPTWDPKDGFDYAKMKEKIEHPIPEDVKGKYLEVVKQRKAEGKGGDDEEEDEDDE